MLRVIAASRSGRAYALLVLLAAGLAWWQGRAAVVFDFTLLRPEVRLPYSEVAGLVVALLGAIVMRPRMWEWDRTAGARAGVVATGVTVVGCAAPVLVVAISFGALPDGYAASWRLSNALVMASSVFLMSPLLGPALTSAVALLAYFARGIVINLWSDLSLLPIATYPELPSNHPHAHWLAAGALFAAAAGVNLRTRGLSTRTHRLIAGDE